MFVAECPGLSASWVFLFNLQWGRNMFVAEWSLPASPLSLMAILQWGRNMFVAECVARPQVRGAVRLPSMGPQHVRCGMPGGRHERAYRGGDLQWGRNMFVAECKKGMGSRIRNIILQWGRNMFVAECATHYPGPNQAGDIPSMGPQHVRCGMYLLGRNSIGSICPSMGPQHVRCGMLHGAIPLHAGPRRPSMGPQHVRCGMDAVNASILASSYALQWGRNMFVAECLLPVRTGSKPAVPSMGPQHVRCGMNARNARAHQEIVPSMGPQHVRCGMLLTVDVFSPSYTTFNGAATCSLRNVLSPTTYHAWCTVLQWGRNMFVAEWPPPELVVLGTPAPSMGPQHVRCGMHVVF